MSKDLVERLRAAKRHVGSVALEAADTLSTLQAENERLRELVDWAAKDFEVFSKVYGVLTNTDREYFAKCSGRFRSALTPTLTKEPS